MDCTTASTSFVDPCSELLPPKHEFGLWFDSVTRTHEFSSPTPSTTPTAPFSSLIICVMTKHTPLPKSVIQYSSRFSQTVVSQANLRSFCTHLVKQAPLPFETRNASRCDAWPQLLLSVVPDPVSIVSCGTNSNLVILHFYRLLAMLFCRLLAMLFCCLLLMFFSAIPGGR